MACVAQWMTLQLDLTAIGQKQQILTKVTDSPLISVIKNKTGLQLSYFQIIASSQPYAFMIGIPGHPFMTLSSNLNSTFNDSEKEYRVFYYSQISPHIYLISIIGILFGLFCIQYGMVSEKEADQYANSRLHY